MTKKGKHRCTEWQDG